MSFSTHFLLKKKEKLLVERNTENIFNCLPESANCHPSVNASPTTHDFRLSRRRYFRIPFITGLILKLKSFLPADMCERKSFGYLSRSPERKQKLTASEVNDSIRIHIPKIKRRCVGFRPPK